jgi:hypothetical protein
VGSPARALLPVVLPKPAVDETLRKPENICLYAIASMYHTKCKLKIRGKLNNKMVNCMLIARCLPNLSPSSDCAITLNIKRLCSPRSNKHIS